LFKSLLEGFNSNKAFLNFLLYRNSQKAAIGAGVKDEFSTLEQGKILELVSMTSKSVGKLEEHVTFLKLLYQMYMFGKMNTSL